MAVILRTTPERLRGKPALQKAYSTYTNKYVSSKLSFDAFSAAYLSLANSNDSVTDLSTRLKMKPKTIDQINLMFTIRTPKEVEEIRRISKGKGKRIPKDKEGAIARDLDEQRLTMDAIMAKHDVSSAVVYRIRDERKSRPKALAKRIAERERGSRRRNPSRENIIRLLNEKTWFRIGRINFHDYIYTHTEIADRLGVGRSFVSSLLPLTNRTKIDNDRVVTRVRYEEHPTQFRAIALVEAGKPSPEIVDELVRLEASAKMEPKKRKYYNYYLKNARRFIEFIQQPRREFETIVEHLRADRRKVTLESIADYKWGYLTEEAVCGYFEQWRGSGKTVHQSQKLKPVSQKPRSRRK